MISKIPAAMVKEPKTRNIADKTPDDASACSRASSFTARTERERSSIPTKESRCCSSAARFWFDTLPKTSIERSFSSPTARISASLMLMRPRMTGSKSVNEDKRSSSTKEPLIVRLIDSSEPKAYWNNPVAASVEFSTDDRGSKRSPIWTSP